MIELGHQDQDFDGLTGWHQLPVHGKFIIEFCNPVCHHRSFAIAFEDGAEEEAPCFPVFKLARFPNIAAMLKMRPLT